MAKVKASSDVALDMSKLDVSELFHGSATYGASDIVVKLSDGSIVDFSGTFHYSGGHLTDDSTVSGIKEKDPSGHVMYTFSGEGVSAAELVADVQQGESDKAIATLLAGNDKIYGSNLADVLIGLGGDDHLDGMAGADTMTGGVGDDTYYVDNKHDKVVEKADEGSDRVESSISYKLGANVERLDLTGTGKINGTGNDLDNTLTGNDKANVLKGGAGADHLYGHDGNDTLVGGAGFDHLTGGAGKDVFKFADGDTAATKGKADDIVDFSHKEGDKIDLTGIDAIKGGTHDAFTFIGTAAFDGKAGELRVLTSGHDTLIAGDTDGDKHADFYIRLDGSHTIHASDFTAASLIHG